MASFVRDPFPPTLMNPDFMTPLRKVMSDLQNDSSIKYEKAKIEDVEILYFIINKAYRTSSGWTNESGLVRNDRITKHGLVQLIEHDKDPIFVARNENEELLGCIQLECNCCNF